MEIWHCLCYLNMSLPGSFDNCWHLDDTSLEHLIQQEPQVTKHRKHFNVNKDPWCPQKSQCTLSSFDEVFLLSEAYGKVFEAKCNVKKAAATWWTQICSRTTCIAHDFSCSQASIMYHVQFGVSNILVPVKDTAYRSASLIESVLIENSFKTEICDTSQIFCLRVN